jgi:hypothetical protein
MTKTEVTSSEPKLVEETSAIDSAAARRRWSVLSRAIVKSAAKSATSGEKRIELNNEEEAIRFPNYGLVRIRPKADEGGRSNRSEDEDGKRRRRVWFDVTPADGVGYGFNFEVSILELLAELNIKLSRGACNTQIPLLSSARQYRLLRMT